MTNAIKFTADEPRKREITVSIGASIGPPNVRTPKFEYVPMRNPAANITLGDDWGTGDVIHLRFKVEDTGCGLKPEEKQVLFERFSQASPRTHAVYGGSGLGLFISRQLAELHGGQIGVASNAGVGSTFGFFIKARRAQSPATSAAEGHPVIDKDHNRAAHIDHMVAEAREEIATTRPRGSSAHGKRPTLTRSSSKPSANLDPRSLHVLVVEDNLVNQKVLVKQLTKVGCTVSAANNGVEALVHLAKTEFQFTGGEKLSVILMDLEMPEMDGLTCVRRIREMEATGEVMGHVPTIAVTANVRDEQVQEAKSAGMVSLMSPSFQAHTDTTAGRRRLEAIPHTRTPRQSGDTSQRRCRELTISQSSAGAFCCRTRLIGFSISFSHNRLDRRSRPPLTGHISLGYTSRHAQDMARARSELRACSHDGRRHDGREHGYR